MLLACLMGAAFAFTPDEIQARLTAVAPLAPLRLSTRHPPISAETVATLRDGHIETGLASVQGKKAKIAWGVAVVKVSMAKLFSAVNDDRNKTAYSKLSVVTLLEGDYCGARRLAFQFLPVPWVSDRWWVVEQRRNTVLSERSEGKVRELVWVKQADGAEHLDAASAAIAAKGIQAAENDGGWWLLSLDDDTTLLQFWALSDPGGSVPAGLASQFAGGSIRDTIGRMESLARKGPSCEL